MAARLNARVARALDVVRLSGPLWAASLAVDAVAPVGILRAWRPRRIAVETLASQVESILLAWGMSAEHAATTVRHVLYADRHGIDSHGVAMLAHYRRGLAEGWIAIDPRIAVVRETETTALVDGGGGLGHVPADLAMRLAIAKCRPHGVACVAVRNSGHYGAAGGYAAMAARESLLGIATTTTREPAVVPAQGVEAMLGTNPIALAAPAARNRPFLLDMATSTAPLGRLTAAWRAGRSIPAGWAIDPSGAPVTSPRRATRFRRLTPLGATPDLGSHKGYGLATAVEVLAGVLTGARRSARQRATGTEARVGHLFFAIDPARIRGDGAFGADLDDLLDDLRASRPLDPGAPVRTAGDPEYAALEEREQSGIPLARGVVEDLRAVARDAGVPFLLDDAARR